MKEKLKRCPFCGGKAKIQKHYELERYKVECVDCLAGISYYKSEEEALVTWNKRRCECKEENEEIKNKIVYISGSIDGVDDYLERFTEAEMYLASEGYVPINPASIGTDLAGRFGREQILDIDLELLRRCDAIYMLKGWETSCGANREYGYARGRDMVILKGCD